MLNLKFHPVFKQMAITIHRFSDRLEAIARPRMACVSTALKALTSHFPAEEYEYRRVTCRKYLVTLRVTSARPGGFVVKIACP